MGIIVFIVVTVIEFLILFFGKVFKGPLLIITMLLCFIANCLCYSLIKAWKDRNISQIETNVKDKEVTTSIQLLRYAASVLAVISFIATAEGLCKFVFEKAWHAYLVSLAVQSILLVFNFLFFHFYIRINNLDKFPLFFKRVLIYFVVFLFIIALMISSTFSFVFIANNAYSKMRAKNSNITIERFLKEEAYRLRNINDEIGEDLRRDITDRIEELQNAITAQAAITAAEIETRINDALSNPIIYIEETKEFYSQAELDEDVVTAVYPNEYEIIRNLLTDYQNIYHQIYTDKYLPANDFYTNLKNEPNKSQSIKDKGLEHYDMLKLAKDEVDKYLNLISELKSKHYDRYIFDYRERAVMTFLNLNSSIDSLISLYDKILSIYQEGADSASTSTTTTISVNDILNVVYMDEYGNLSIQDIQAFLSEQQEVLLNASTIDEEKLKDLAEFMEAFNDFAKYAELKKLIDEFIDDDLSITYYIKRKDEKNALESTEKLKVVSEDAWTEERKEDFTKFISCLKLLPAVEAYKEKYNVSALMRDYKTEQVLQSAYTINRDLLENISEFEKAINYFKYDFSLMAVFSLIMALFLDVASFLTGGFMFAASFFKKNKKEKMPTNTDGADAGNKNISASSAPDEEDS